MTLVRVEDEEDIRTITLDRPDRLNALGPQVREALENAVADTADGEARIVVFQGAGRCFSAGADLQDPEPGQPSWQRRRPPAGRRGRLLDSIEAPPPGAVAGPRGHGIRRAPPPPASLQPP